MFYMFLGEVTTLICVFVLSESRLHTAQAVQMRVCAPELQVLSLPLPSAEITGIRHCTQLLKNKNKKTPLNS